MEPYWTDWIFGLTMQASGWLSLWGGIAGAAAAFSLSVWYQHWQRENLRKEGRRKTAQALLNLREQLLPLVEEDEEVDSASASNAVTRARAVLGWATNHPELWSLDEWADLREAQTIIEVWVEDNSRLGGFVAALYNGQCSPKYMRRLAKSVEPFLAIPI